MSTAINFNGQLLPSDSAFLNHENRGIRYGDCLFETLRSSGIAIFFLEDHYFRLMASMRILRMEIPMEFTMEYIEKQIKKTLKGNHLEERPARIRFTVFRKNGGLYLPHDNEVSYIIECNSLDAPSYTLAREPYEVELFKDFYVNEDMLSNLKSNNRLINVTGSIYARENGYANCLLLNGSKNVVEALNGNLFIVHGNNIKTAPLSDGCLNGIVRKQLI
jgi:branched-chain amino acid aminotransferase